MPLQSTSNANSCQPPGGWPTVTSTADQPGTLLEQQWTLHVFRTADDLPEGDRWQWCRYRCLPHCHDRPGRVVEEVG